MSDKIIKLRKGIADVVEVKNKSFLSLSTIYLFMNIILTIFILLPFLMPNSDHAFIEWLTNNQFVFLYLFLVDFIIKYFTSDLRNSKMYKKYNWKVFLIPTSIWTLFDSIIFLAFIPGLQWMIIFKSMTLLKIINLFPKIDKAVSFIFRGLLREGKAIFVVLIMLSMIITIGGIMFFVFEAENPEVNSIWDAFWFAFISATTIGYGDITPDSAGGRIIAMIFSIVGIINIAVLTGIAIFGIQTEARMVRLKHKHRATKKEIVFRTKEFNYWLNRREIIEEAEKEIDGIIKNKS